MPHEPLDIVEAELERVRKELRDRRAEEELLLKLLAESAALKRENGNV